MAERQPAQNAALVIETALRRAIDQLTRRPPRSGDRHTVIAQEIESALRRSGWLVGDR